MAATASAELAAAGADQAELIDDDGGAAGQEGSTVLRAKAAKESQRLALVKVGVQILDAGFRHRSRACPSTAQLLSQTALAFPVRPRPKDGM